jgi:hypothetical protein
MFIEHAFSHHQLIGVIHSFGETNGGDEIRTIVRVALSGEKSFELDPLSGTLLK